MTFWTFLICMAISFAAGAVYGAVLMVLRIRRLQNKWVAGFDAAHPGGDQTCQEHHPQHDPGLKQ